MVEITCPYCEQEYERNDLMEVPDDGPPSIAPGQVTLDDEPVCGHPKSGEGNCTRTVENPGDKCWQHEEDEEDG